MQLLADSFSQIRESVTGLDVTAAALADLDDDTLTAAHRDLAGLAGSVQKLEALTAAEIARRSARSLGQAGLSSRLGFTTPTAMVQHLGGHSRATTGRLISVGTMIAEAESAQSLKQAAQEHPDDEALARVAAEETPWHSGLGAAVADGRIGTEAAASLRRGLGEPAAGVTADQLRDVLGELLRDCAGVDADAVFKMARHARDRVDAAGVAARVQAQRERQYWRQWVKPDGMVHGEYDLAAENGAYLTDVYDQLLSPRLGGPRFVNASKKAWAQSLVEDPRSTGRIAAEALVELIRLGADADPGRVFGGNRPAVRVIVHRETLTSRDGFGVIENCQEPVSLDDVERHLCQGGFVPVSLDDGQVINYGRQKRLFTWAQKNALAVRDGGCMWPDCDRPASWTEAHHIIPWHAAHGKTNIADGISLCRKHHMLLHNQHWNITRRGPASYFLTPPATIDTTRTPIPLTSKTTLNLTSPVRLDHPNPPAHLERGPDDESDVECGSRRDPGQAGTPEPGQADTHADVTCSCLVTREGHPVRRPPRKRSSRERPARARPP